MVVEDIMSGGSVLAKEKLQNGGPRRCGEDEKKYQDGIEVEITIGEPKDARIGIVKGNPNLDLWIKITTATSHRVSQHRIIT